MFHKVFYINKLSIMFDLCPADTVWWDRVKTNNRPNQRIDNLFSVSRIFISDEEFRNYCIRICIGRIRILLAIRS